MARSKTRRARPRSGPGPATSQDRQREVSSAIAGVGRRHAPGAARRAAGRPAPPRAAVLSKPVKGRRRAVQPTALLLRFISCGLVSLVAGLIWFLTHRNQQIGPAGALFGALLLLSGFLVGGVGWYLRDARLRIRDPRRMDDESIVFSFAVFVLTPLLVLGLVLVVWLVALAIGSS